MADELEIETIFKLKVDGLKEELIKRNLPKSGSKSELQERLLNYITTHDIAAITSKDEEVLEDTTEDEELDKDIDESLDKIDTPTALADDKSKFLDDVEVEGEKENTEDEQAAQPVLDETTTTTETTADITEPVKSKKITLPLTESEKIEQRSKRFGAVVSQTEKKKARLDRFGVNETAKSDAPSGNKLSQRAARFGTTATAETKPTEGKSAAAAPSEKLSQRQDRFLDEKIKKRQERFGVIEKPAAISTKSDMETRKQQRAMKFGVK